MMEKTQEQIVTATADPILAFIAAAERLRSTIRSSFEELRYELTHKLKTVVQEVCNEMIHEMIGKIDDSMSETYSHLPQKEIPICELETERDSPVTISTVELLAVLPSPISARNFSIPVVLMTTPDPLHPEKTTVVFSSGDLSPGLQFHSFDVTRLEKLDFPRFGGDKIRDWLFKVERFFEIDHNPDKLKKALRHLATTDLRGLCNEMKVERCRATKDVASGWRFVSYVLSPGSRPQLDLSKAEIQRNFELLYFSRHEDYSNEYAKRKRTIKERLGLTNGNLRSYPVLGGRLHFVKFETHKINEYLDFIHSKQLLRRDPYPRNSKTLPVGTGVINVTSGGTYKFADLLNEGLSVSIEKEDEMHCLVSGANFLLKSIQHEAFTCMEGEKELVQIDSNDLYLYLLVNVGPGVSIIKVDGEGNFERVSGTNVGGGIYWGLGKLLTKCKSFDELLELSQRGDNGTINMLVGVIYGGMDYSKTGFSASTIVSSFGKAISENKELENYRPEDNSMSLLRRILYNIGQISYLKGLKRIFFGGFFIRGHAYTMNTISLAVHFWSTEDMQAMFLRQEGFLDALGEFMSYEKHRLDELMSRQLVERFPMGAPYTGGMFSTFQATRSFH